MGGFAKPQPVKRPEFHLGNNHPEITSKLPEFGVNHHEIIVRTLEPIICVRSGEVRICFS